MGVTLQFLCNECGGNKVKKFISQINSVLGSDDKTKLIYLFCFTLFIAFIETVSVTVLMPYISLANDFTLIESNSYYQYLYRFFGFSQPVHFIISFGYLIIFFYIFRALLNTVYIHKIMSFSQMTYYEIINNLFRNYVKMPYKNFIRYNTSSLTKIIVNEAVYLTDLFRAFLILLSEMLILLLIYSVLLYINYQITLIITVLILLLSFLIVKTISKRVKENGLIREQYQKIFYEILNKTFNNIKIIKLQKMDTELNEFETASRYYTNANKISGSFQQFPRLIFEATAFSIVIVIILFLLYSTHHNIAHYFGLITIFVLGLYRLLPSVTRILLSYNQILFYYKSLEIIYTEKAIEREKIGNENIDFKDVIELKNISFAYDEKNVIQNLNLELRKNEKIAFIGESGSGKSTLVDIIMGLHEVTSGEILIDGQKISRNNLNSWRHRFGYIPQSVYLFDGTVSENVAFGLDIDKDKVQEVLMKANIWEFLKEKEGLATYVGENGVMLSGGQKQRIAIARALYQNPDILVLDEATSALDEATEAKIMEEVYKLAEDKTLIIIAHRLSTIRKCDKVYRVDKGKIISV